jgi:hypothetical protein
MVRIVLPASGHVRIVEHAEEIPGIQRRLDNDFDPGVVHRIHEVIRSSSHHVFKSLQDLRTLRPEDLKTGAADD